MHNSLVILAVVDLIRQLLTLSALT